FVSFSLFFFSSRRRHTRSKRDWSSDVCSSDLVNKVLVQKGLSSEHIAEAIKLAKRDRLIIQEVPKNKLDDISEGGNHQGMAAYKIGRASCRERGKNTLRSAECRSTSERTTVSD